MKKSITGMSVLQDDGGGDRDQKCLWPSDKQEAAAFMNSGMPFLYSSYCVLGFIKCLRPQLEAFQGFLEFTFKEEDEIYPDH